MHILEAQLIQNFFAQVSLKEKKKKKRRRATLILIHAEINSKNCAAKIDVSFYTII